MISLLIIIVIHMCECGSILFSLSVHVFGADNSKLDNVSRAHSWRKKEFLLWTALLDYSSQRVVEFYSPSLLTLLRQLVLSSCKAYLNNHTLEMSSVIFLTFSEDPFPQWTSWSSGSYHLPWYFLSLKYNYYLKELPARWWAPYCNLFSAFWQVVDLFNRLHICCKWELPLQW